MNRNRFSLVTSVLLLTVANVAAQPTYQGIEFAVDGVGEQIVPVDLDGDGLRDLLISDQATLSVYFQRKQHDAPFNFKQADAVITLPGKAVGWDVDVAQGRSLAEGATQAKRILALVDGKEVLAWTPRQRKFGEAETVLDDLPGFLPLGAYPLKMLRDFDGDGLNDLVIPGAGNLHLYRQSAGGYEAGVPVRTSLWIESRLEAPDLNARVGQSVRIPLVRIRDVNNDGHRDLIAWSDLQLEVYLGRAEGGYPQQPSYRFDASAVQERVGQVDFDNIDFSNLSGLLAYTWQFELDDVDGDKIEDLLLREGGKVTLYGGTESGMEFETPRQVLKSGGNVLTALLVDEDNDGLKDLWLMRVETVSLGNLFVWLAVSGSVDIETFVYKNQGKRFASRPSRKITLTVKFPSLLRSVDLVTDASREENTANALRGSEAEIDSERERGDALILQQKAIAVYLNKIQQQSRDNGVFFVKDYSPDRDNYVIDLREVLENPVFNDGENFAQLRDQQPDFHLSLTDYVDAGQDLRNANLTATDLNGDGADDILLFLKRDQSFIKGVLFLSQP